MGCGYQSSEKILREICPESETASPRAGMAVVFLTVSIMAQRVEKVCKLREVFAL
jgi:hypothetical protein